MNSEQHLGSPDFFAAYIAGGNQSGRPADKSTDKFNGEDPAIVAITGKTPTLRHVAREEAGKRAKKALTTGAA